MKTIELIFRTDVHEENVDDEKLLSTVKMGDGEPISFEGRGKELVPLQNLDPLTLYDVKAMLEKPSEIKLKNRETYKLKKDFTEVVGGGTTYHKVVYKKKLKMPWEI